jgi:aryl-alcohol dehydrogenase-like predicted oxidoreductase
MPYGVTNTSGVPGDAEVRRMLASSAALAGLDTAPLYGKSERRIGHLAPHLPIQTKVACAGRTERQMHASLDASLRHLHRTSVDTLLVHDWGVLPHRERLTALRFMRDVKSSGQARRVGVSIYDAEDAVLGVDVIQLPASVLDQSAAASPQVARARRNGVVIQARSIYLQGVALAAYGLRTCLGFIWHHAGIDEVVVGCATAAELAEFLEAWDDTLPRDDWASMASTDRTVTDPRTWS